MVQNKNPENSAQATAKRNLCWLLACCTRVCPPVLCSTVYNTVYYKAPSLKPHCHASLTASSQVGLVNGNYQLDAGEQEHGQNQNILFLISRHLQQLVCSLSGSNVCDTTLVPWLRQSSPCSSSPRGASGLLYLLDLTSPRLFLFVFLAVLKSQSLISCVNSFCSNP